MKLRSVLVLAVAMAALAGPVQSALASHTCYGVVGTHGNEFHNLFEGGIGADTYSGLGGGDEIYGAPLSGASLDAGDRLCGNDGDDIVRGYAGNDSLSGGEGADGIQGDSGADLMHGVGGNDQLLGGTGADQLYGNLGNDILQGGDGNDRIDGGSGTDTCYGNAGTDTFISCERILG